MNPKSKSQERRLAIHRPAQCIKCLAKVLHPMHDNGTVNEEHMEEFLADNTGPTYEGEGYERDTDHE